MARAAQARSPGIQDAGAVHVVFYDEATGKAFAETVISGERLPESFEARTTMHLGKDDWTVVEARPVTAAEFRRTGELVLIVRKANPVVMIDPGEVLFSLPTINDYLPGIAPGSSKLNQDVIELHEDDWRQVEWVSGSAGKVIASELDAIRRIYETERVEHGFRKVHLRKEIRSPLAGCGVRLEDLIESMGPSATRLAGVSYRDVAGIVESSFALRFLSSVEVYGVAPGGVIEALCCANRRTNNAPQPDVDNLAGFAARHNLVLVDWCAAAAIGPVEEDYVRYFAGDGAGGVMPH
jgi:hypothetical protein